MKLFGSGAGGRCLKMTGLVAHMQKKYKIHGKRTAFRSLMLCPFWGVAVLSLSLDQRVLDVNNILFFKNYKNNVYLKLLFNLILLGSLFLDHVGDILANATILNTGF